MTAQHYIDTFNLNAHPEGGYYQETYRADEVIGNRSVCTVIYFLLTQGQISAFHRLKSDEFWYYHDGAPLDVFIIDQQGQLHEHKLGLGENCTPQLLLPKNCWFAARSRQDSFTFISCSVAPGFDFADFELAEKALLVEEYPKFGDLIDELSIK
ncbi:MAG: cupin domain-containing protein [Lentisphaeraceae bacterium]|nr:cupin domain-containing protein [Lentisphaeraceae bacterium]